MKNPCMILMILTVFVTAAKPIDVDFKSASDARAYFKPRGRAPIEWDGTASMTRLSSAITTITETRWHGPYSGDYLGSTFSWFTSVTIAVGTVVALPNDDFHVVSKFTYLGNDGRTVQTGACVSVEIGISSAGAMPNGLARMRAVKNLCESGMAIPGGKGRPGRICSLKSSAKMRFGASAVEVYYNWHRQSKVVLVLLNCREECACQDVKPICYEGIRRTKRLKSRTYD